VWVKGEVSQPRPSAAGHLYLTLKDDEAVLPCVLWRSTLASLRFRIEGGQEVVALGGIDVYPPHGTYQLVVRHVEPLGAGALQLAFEQLRRRLEAEGLFAPARKRPLPAMPRRICLVTSRTGAAVRDMVTVVTRRFPGVTILLVDVRVQGAAAAPEVAAGLAFADLHARADVIVCGRGGGSIEDLWAFNEEVVARAIVACRVPVVSAVGHETDVTIADLVADLRAATPSQAGELVVPARDELLQRLFAQAQRLQQRIRTRVDAAWQRLEAIAERPVLRDARGLLLPRARHLGHLAKRLEAQSPVALLRRRAETLAGLASRLPPPLDRRLAVLRERLVDRSRRSTAGLRARLERVRAHVDALDGRLRALSPVAVLGRGYSLTTREDGRVVRAGDDVRPGEKILTRVADGATIGSRVEGTSIPPPEARG
jgi:exodeoxyribonuclease VII large subunit